MKHFAERRSHYDTTDSGSALRLRGIAEGNPRLSSGAADGRQAAEDGNSLGCGGEGEGEGGTAVRRLRCTVEDLQQPFLSHARGLMGYGPESRV